jgi:hypothetical protein
MCYETSNVQRAAAPFVLSWVHTSARACAGGCWSQARPGVFFTARQDGVLDAWDLHFKHQAPTLQVQARRSWHLASAAVLVQGMHLIWAGNVALKECSAMLSSASREKCSPTLCNFRSVCLQVSDAPLTCLANTLAGEHLVVGSAAGSCAVLALSRSLWAGPKDEKAAVGAMLERESLRCAVPLQPPPFLCIRFCQHRVPAVLNPRQPLPRSPSTLRAASCSVNLVVRVRNSASDARARACSEKNLEKTLKEARLRARKEAGKGKDGDSAGACDEDLGALEDEFAAKTAGAPGG